MNRSYNQLGVPQECYDGPVPVQGNEPIAARCLKQLAMAQERLNIVSLNLRDKMEPVCAQECPPAECAGIKGMEPYPPLFNEMREMIRRLNETADRLESLLHRCEI